MAKETDTNSCTFSKLPEIIGSGQPYEVILINSLMRWSSLREMKDKVFSFNWKTLWGDPLLLMVILMNSLRTCQYQIDDGGDGDEACYRKSTMYRFLWKRWSQSPERFTTALKPRRSFSPGFSKRATTKDQRRNSLKVCEMDKFGTLGHYDLSLYQADATRSAGCCRFRDARDCLEKITGWSFWQSKKI